MTFPTEKLNAVEEKIFKSNLRIASLTIENSIAAVQACRPQVHNFPYEEQLFKEASKENIAMIHQLRDVQTQIDDLLRQYQAVNP
jgi:hypothetical protein